MPEHHERNKEKKEPVFTGECGDVEYGLRLHECDASSARDGCSGAVNEVSSNIKVDVNKNKTQNSKVNPQQIATDVVQDTSLNHKKSCFNQYECGLQLDEEVSNNETECKSKITLDENDEIVPENKHREVSVQNELSEIDQDLSLTENDHAEGPQEKNYPLRQDPNSTDSLKKAVKYQESSEIVYETLRLINEAIQLEDESTEGNASCSVNQETEFMLEVTNVGQMDTENTGLNAPQNTTCAKKDSLPKLQRANSEQGTENDSRKSIPVLYDTPLVFPETSNITISISSGSSEKKEKLRCTRTTPHESIGEQTITSDTTDEIDSLGRKPPDNNLAHADTQQQFDIEVRTHPDGGWGWVVCLGAFLIQFIALGMQNTAGIVYTELVKVLKSQRGATAWVGSLATGIMFFLGPLTTSLCERLGCRIVTICGGLICIAGLLLSSMVSSLLPLYFTYGLLFGTGTSLCYFPTIIVLSKYFKRRIAVVNGLVTSGSGVGTLVIGPAVQALFLRFGVANTFRIVAAIFSLVLICGASFRPVPAKYSQYTNRTNRGEARKLFDWSVFKNKGYVIWVASLGTFQLGYFVPFVHLVRHAEDLGVNPTDASFLIGYLSVASTVGRLFFGKMADLSCVNRIRMYQLGVFSIGLCSFLVPLATGYGGLTAYAITFGFFEACFVLLIPLVTSDIVGAEKMSYGLGSAFTVMAFPMFLGPPIAGWMYDVLGDYAGAFYFCGIISLTAALFMFFVPLSSTKTKSSGLRKRLKWNNISHFEFLRRLFGCLCRKELHESKTLSNVQYSVIIKSEGVDSV